MVVDNASSGSLVKLSYGVEITFLEQVTKQNRGWHPRETEVAMRPSMASFVDKEQKKKDKELD